MFGLIDPPPSVVCFNSNVVRLKVISAIVVVECKSFQFQCGAIKSSQLYRNLPSVNCFNSNVVRLKAEKILDKDDLAQVSIPMWCD